MSSLFFHAIIFGSIVSRQESTREGALVVRCLKNRRCDLFDIFFAQWVRLVDFSLELALDIAELDLDFFFGLFLIHQSGPDYASQ